VQTKSEEAYRTLKERIMDGTFGPGHRLVIDQLRRRYGISSVPWRESLRMLEAEGWVEFVPNIGFQVKTFDTGEWKRTMQLLARLEGFATALSARNLTSADIATARDLNKQMGEALGDFDTGRFGVLNRRFHELLCSRSGDPRLEGLVTAEWSRAELIRRSAFWYAPGRAVAAITEHDSIVDLIEGGADPEMIETVTQRHEVNTVEKVLKYEDELPEEDKRAQLSQR
jgi:DNA-binding GntR family transcriptional regulator